MKRKRSGNYEEYLIESLKDPKRAEAYLDAAWEEGDRDVFLLALHHVVQARVGISKAAEKTGKSRSSLYRALSKEGNPSLRSIGDILDATGIAVHFSIVKNNKLVHKHA